MVDAHTMTTVAELAAAIEELDQLDDVARVAAARRLALSMPKHLAAIADETTYAITREVSQPVVAERLGVTVKQVERAVTRHRARTRAV